MGGEEEEERQRQRQREVGCDDEIVDRSILTTQQHTYYVLSFYCSLVPQLIPQKAKVTNFVCFLSIYVDCRFSLFSSGVPISACILRLLCFCFGSPVS